MKDYPFLGWLWLVVVPALLAFDMALHNLNTWASGLQMLLEMKGKDTPPDVASLRDGVAWSYVGLRWFLLWTVLIGIGKTIQIFKKSDQQKMKS